MKFFLSNKIAKTVIGSNIIDVKIKQPESFASQMLSYSEKY